MIEAIDAPESAEKPTRLQLFRALLWLGTSAFGGGLLAHFHHLVIERKRWMSPVLFLEQVTLAQLLPGPNMLNLGSILGQRLGGMRGSVLATIAITLPGVIVVIILGAIFTALSGRPEVEKVLASISAAAVGLVAATTLRVVPGAKKSSFAIPLGLVTFALIAFVKVPLLWTLVIMAPIAVFLNRPKH